MTFLDPHVLVRPDATIRYWTGGDATGPTVVLLHGATLDHRAWAPQVDVLQDRFHVYLVDTGRINISGLNERYSMYFARSLDEVVREAIGQQQ